MNLVDAATAARVSALIDALVAAGDTVAVAESLTGGLVCSTLVHPSGASRAIAGGVVAYSIGAKMEVLGVDEETLWVSGAVDSEVATQMAFRVRAQFSSTIGISTTGVAGPDVQDGVGVGTVFIGMSRDGREIVEEHHFTGSRDDIRWATVDACLTLLENSLRVE